MASRVFVQCVVRGSLPRLSSMVTRSVMAAPHVRTSQLRGFAAGALCRAPPPSSSVRSDAEAVAVEDAEFEDTFETDTFDDLGEDLVFLPPATEGPPPPEPPVPRRKRDIVKRPSRAERDAMFSEAVAKIYDVKSFPSPLRRNVLMRVFNFTRSAQQLHDTALPAVQFWHQHERGGPKPLQQVAKLFIETCIRYKRYDYILPGLLNRTRYGFDVERYDALDQAFRYLTRPASLPRVDANEIARDKKALADGIPEEEWKNIEFTPAGRTVIKNIHFLDHHYKLVDYMYTYFPASDGMPDALGLISGFAAALRCNLHTTEAAQEYLQLLNKKGYAQIYEEVFDFDRKGLKTWIGTDIDAILEYTKSTNQENLVKTFDYLKYSFKK